MVNEIFHQARIVPYNATDERRMNIVPRLCRNNKQTRALLRPNEIQYRYRGTIISIILIILFNFLSHN